MRNHKKINSAHSYAVCSTPPLFFLCSYAAVPVCVSPSAARSVKSNISALSGAEDTSAYLPVADHCPRATHPHISICLLTKTTPTDDNTGTIVQSVTVCFICKTKTTFRISRCSPGPVPLLVNTLYPYLTQLPWVALICMSKAFQTEQSTQEKRWDKKKKEKETKSYFYGKLRSDCGALSQVNLNKSIKAYPNIYKNIMLFPNCSLFAIYIWQSKLWPGI